MSLTNEEWDRVQEALVKGGLRQVVEDLITSHTPTQVNLSPENRLMIEQAYDAGDGHGITIVPGEDPAWFVAMCKDDLSMCEGIEHEGVLYTIVHLSGGGLCSVLVGSGLVDNEVGPVFHTVPEAKAYIQGRIEQ